MMNNINTTGVLFCQRVCLTFFAALFFAFTVHSADAHPFHVSVGEMQYDAETKHVEIALQVWPNDLERSIKRRWDKSIDLDGVGDDAMKSTDELIEKYLQSAFNIADKKNTEFKIQYVGRELEGSQLWIYLQFPVEGRNDLDGLRITNRICFESLHDQVNTIKVKTGKKQTVLQFTRDEPTAVLKKFDDDQSK